MARKDCSPEYHQPFRSPLWRFLWWLDDDLHRRHVSNRAQRWLCDLVDRRLR